MARQKVLALANFLAFGVEGGRSGGPWLQGRLAVLLSLYGRATRGGSGGVAACCCYKQSPLDSYPVGRTHVGSRLNGRAENEKATAFYRLGKLGARLGGVPV